MRLSNKDMALVLTFDRWECEGCGVDMWLREQPWSDGIDYCTPKCRAWNSPQSEELCSVIAQLVEQGRYHVDPLAVADALLGWEKYGRNTARSYQARAHRLRALKFQLSPALTGTETVAEVVAKYTQTPLTDSEIHETIVP
jgi:hypothetical protein